MIVMSCCILHNIAIRRNLDLDINDAAIQDIIRRDREGMHDHVAQRGNEYLLGFAKRREIIENHFTN